MAVYRLLDLKTKAQSSYVLHLDYFDRPDTILRKRSKSQSSQASAKQKAL